MAQLLQPASLSIVRSFLDSCTRCARADCTKTNRSIYIEINNYMIAAQGAMPGIFIARSVYLLQASLVLNSSSW